MINNKCFCSVLLGLSFLFATQLNADFLVADNFGNQVVRYSDTGTSLGAFVSAGSGGLNGATGLVLLANGDLLVSSQSNNQILRYNGTTGASLGAFATTNMTGPSHMVSRANGNLLVGNFSGNSVGEFDSNGNFLGTFTSGTPGAGLQGVSSFAVDGTGNVYVGSFNSGEIFVYNSSGAYQSTFATGLTGASGLWFDGGDLWVSSLLSSTVTRLNSAGGVVTSFSTGEIAPGQGTFPSFITSSPFGSNEILIALAGAGGVYRYNIDGSTTGPVNPFLIGGGLQVPGEVLQVAAVPEPTSAIGLSLLTLGLLSVRRRKN